MKYFLTLIIALFAASLTAQTVKIEGSTLTWEAQAGHGSQAGLTTNKGYAYPTIRTRTANKGWIQDFEGASRIIANDNDTYYVLSNTVEEIGGDLLTEMDKPQVLVYGDTMDSHASATPLEIFGTGTQEYDRITGFGKADRIDVSGLGITHPDQLFYEFKPIERQGNQFTPSIGFLWASTQGDSAHASIGWILNWHGRVHFDKETSIIYAKGQTTYSVEYENMDGQTNIVAKGLTGTEYEMDGFGRYTITATNQFRVTYEVGSIVIAPAHHEEGEYPEQAEVGYVNH